MTDNIDTTGEGRTRWIRFGAALAAGGLAAGVVVFGLSQGALAASFAVSGDRFKVTADQLNGQGFTLFGSADVESDGQTGHPVAVNGFKKATIDKFCLSVVSPEIPVVGSITLKQTAPSVQASNLVLDAEAVDADLTLTNAEIGRDASTLTKSGIQGQPGRFGIQADTAKLGAVKTAAWSTTAGTLQLNGLHLAATQGAEGECF